MQVEPLRLWELTMKTREATSAELLARYGRQHGWRKSYRHFISERLAPRARHGVSHVQYTTAKLIVDGDKLFVRRAGELTELTATVGTLDCGKEIVFDLRIKSEYLKPL